MNEWQLIGYLDASIEDALRLMSRQPAVARQRLKAALAKVQTGKAGVDLHAAGLKQFHAETLERLKAISDLDILAELNLDDTQLLELYDLACKLAYAASVILNGRRESREAEL